MAHGKVNERKFANILSNVSVSLSEEQFKAVCEAYPYNIVTVHRYDSPTGAREYVTIHTWTQDATEFLGDGYELSAGRTYLKDELANDTPNY